MTNRPAFNRAGLDRIADGVDAASRVVGAGENAVWPNPLGGNVVDLKPVTYLARLTGQRIGAAYGWERVYASVSQIGQVTITPWPTSMFEANGGTPTKLPAFDPNGNTGLAPGSVVYIRPVEQGGTYQYYIVPGSGGVGGAFPYPYSYGTVVLDAIVIPLRTYRCSDGDLEERTEWWLIQANGISATVFDYDPNDTDPNQSYWWCVGGECVQSTTAPEGFNSGPYMSQSQCAENCI
jgi:hypothetical protein